jgi:hypothetical protein
MDQARRLLYYATRVKPTKGVYVVGVRESTDPEAWSLLFMECSPEDEHEVDLGQSLVDTHRAKLTTLAPQPVRVHQRPPGTGLPPGRGPRTSVDPATTRLSENRVSLERQTASSGQQPVDQFVAFGAGHDR